MGSPKNQLDRNIVDKRNQTTALIIANISSFIIPFMGSSINIALPAIGREFAMDAVLLNWVATSYFLAAAIFLVPFGKIADIYGRKRIFTYGMSIFTTASFLLIFSTSGLMLIVLRIFQGIGAAMIFGTGVAILTSVFPAEERGKALGINVTATYIGYSLGPFLGGFLTSYLGWRSLFLISVPLGFIDIYFVLFKLKGEWAEAVGEKFDLTGSILYSLALIAVIYGFSLLPAMWGVGLVLLGTLGILTFLKWETKVGSPVLSIHLFRKNSVFTFSNLAALINYSATFAVGFLLSLYLQYIKGFSPKMAGLILVSQPFTQAIFSPSAGKLSDRIDPRIVASLGMALTTIALFLFIFLSEATTLPFMMASLIILGFGLALFSSPNINAVMSSVEKRFYGVGSATLATMRLVGQTLSMGFTMVIFGIYIGRVRITPEYYPLFLKSVKVAFFIFAILCLGGVFASLARGKAQSKK